MSMKKMGAYVFLTLALSPALAFAQSAAPTKIQVPVGKPPLVGASFEGIIGIITQLINWLFIVLLVLAVLFIIMAAFSYLTAGGDEEKVAAAHKKVIYAVVAVAVAFLAQGVSFIVGELLGVPVATQ